MIAARVCCRRLNNSSVWKRADDLNLLMILLDFCHSICYEGGKQDVKLFFIHVGQKNHVISIDSLVVQQ